MEIQKENNLIQEAFEVEADEAGFCLDQKWGDYENPYENSDTALAFNLFKKGWLAKAQAVPDGFVLVPKEPSADLVNHGHQVFLGHFNEGGQTGGRSLYFAYKAMIEAQEQNHD